MRVAVTGSSGLIGSALVASLRSDGIDVRRVVRCPSATRTRCSGIRPRARSPAARSTASTPSCTSPVKAWPSSAGPTRRSRRSSTRASSGTTAIADACAVASATGRQRARVGIGRRLLRRHRRRASPTSPAPPGTTSSPTCAASGRPRPRRPKPPASAWCTSAPASCRRSAAASSAQLPLFKLGVGGRLGIGRQWVSWITLDDEVRAIRFAIDTASLSRPGQPHRARTRSPTASTPRRSARAVHRPDDPARAAVRAATSSWAANSSNRLTASQRDRAARSCSTPASCSTTPRSTKGCAAAVADVACRYGRAAVHRSHERHPTP